MPVRRHLLSVLSVRRCECAYKLAIAQQQAHFAVELNMSRNTVAYIACVIFRNLNDAEHFAFVHQLACLVHVVDIIVDFDSRACRGFAHEIAAVGGTAVVGDMIRNSLRNTRPTSEPHKEIFLKTFISGHIYGVKTSTAQTAKQ